MAEYLEREKVFEAIYALDSWGSDDDDTSFLDTGEVYDTLAEIETADVRPERHGRWSDKMVAVPQKNKVGYHEDDFAFGFQCSECGEVLNKTTYCGNCGAKMDGKGGESDG